MARVRQGVIHYLVYLLLKLEGYERNEEYRRRALIGKALAILEEGEESEQERAEDPVISPVNSPEYHSPVAEDTDPVPNSVRVGEWRISPAHRWDELSDAQKDVFKQGLEESRRRMPRN